MMLSCTGRNDGTVAVEETRLDSDSQADFITLDVPHTTIATQAEVVPLVVSFLQTGKFSRS